MRKTDDLTPVLFQGLLIAIAVLAAGLGAIIWWQRRFQPSPASAFAMWTAFIWSYFNVLNLAFVPEYLIASTIWTAALRGIALVALAWVIIRFLHSAKRG